MTPKRKRSFAPRVHECGELRGCSPKVWAQTDRARILLASRRSLATVYSVDWVHKSTICPLLVCK